MLQNSNQPPSSRMRGSTSYARLGHEHMECKSAVGKPASDLVPDKFMPMAGAPKKSSGLTWALYAVGCRIYFIELF